MLPLPPLRRLEALETPISANAGAEYYYTSQMLLSETMRKILLSRESLEGCDQSWEGQTVKSHFFSQQLLRVPS